MELFPYQQAAVDKFRAAIAHPHVLIGDDMGLGKTVTAIALDHERRVAKLSERQSEWLHGRRKMTLVVSLKSMLSAWEEHFATWAPDLKVVSLTTTARSFLVEQALKQEADVFIVNWETLRLEPKLCHVPWLHKISDEVQKAKNRKAQLTVAWKRVHALFKTDMSGSWADNKPDDGWSILNHLYPRIWSSYWAFFNHHVVFRSKVNPKNGQTYREVIDVHDAEGLQQLMAPFYIRRLKSEVAPELPEKTYTRITVQLLPQQRRAYNAMAAEMLAWVGVHEDEVLAAPVVIARLIRLQQLAVAYGEMRDVETAVFREVSGDWIVRKADELKQLTAEGKIKVTKDFNMRLLHRERSRKLFLTEPSAKIDAFMELLEQLPSTESIVVFGQSKQAINLLAARLEKAGESYGVLTGDVTSAAARGDLVSRFQAGKFRVFAGTIKAGGEGITIHRASRMVFLDRDWSPSKNRQAEDRIHRIGQRNPVQIFDLVGHDTIDQGRLQRIELKWQWVRQILGK